MTKKLDVDQITSELEGSAFFRDARRADTNALPEEQVTLPPSPKPLRSRSSKSVSNHDNKLASMIASTSDTLIDVIRRIVKVPGKEVSFVRLTPAEKSQLADIVYTYKRQGKKTSENEINRIAVNYILEDYKANGEASVLARVIEALRA